MKSRGAAQRILGVEMMHGTCLSSVDVCLRVESALIMEIDQKAAFQTVRYGQVVGG